MWSSTTAERQPLASRGRICCLRRCLPSRPPRYHGFRGSIAQPARSLCTLRSRRHRRPRNTRYRAPATAYPDRTFTGRITPALAWRTSNPVFLAALDCFAEPVIGRRFAPTRWLAMTELVKWGEEGPSRQQALCARFREPLPEHVLGVHHLGEAGAVDLHGGDDRGWPGLGLAVAHAVVGILERQADEFF